MTDNVEPIRTPMEALLAQNREMIDKIITLAKTVEQLSELVRDQAVHAVELDHRIRTLEGKA